MAPMSKRIFRWLALLAVASQLASSFDLSGLLGSSGGTLHAVDELTDRDFHKFLKEHPVTAILFYAPWCFYSQQVMPAWDTAAQKMELHDPPVKLAKIDASRYGNIGEEYDVRAFPTMKLFVDDAVFDYDGGSRQWQQIVKWVNRHLEREHVLKNAEEAETYLHDNELNVIGLFPDGFDTKTFAKASSHYEDVIFAEARGTDMAKDVADHIARHAALTCETISVGASNAVSRTVDLPRPDLHCQDKPKNHQREEWTDRFGVKVEGTKLTVTRTDRNEGWGQLVSIKCCDDEAKVQKALPKFPVPSVVMFFPHDERFAVYDGDLNDFQALDRWISARRTPSIMRMDQDVADKLFSANPDKLPALFFIDPLLDQAEGTPEQKAFREASSKLRGRAHCVLSGMANNMERRTAEMAGVDADQGGPVITLIETHGGTSGSGQYHAARKFRLDTKGLTADKVVNFISEYEGDRLKPYLKSEPEPSAEDMKIGNVGVLVGTTFTEAAQNPKHDVLVDFYAPWCGHCRKFEPLYKALAKKLKHVKSLKIMKLDATRNEVEGMQITGFPTIVLFPAGDSPKSQVHYRGNRQPEDMIRFLQQECTNKFDETPPPQQAGDEPVESGLLDPDEEDL